MTREQALKEVYGISANKKQHEALQILIPELRESEDERVKKALIDLVSTIGEYYPKPDSRNRMLAWLEKEKEWDELQSEFKNINEAFENGKKEVIDNPEKYGLCRHEEWSEEDERKRNGLIKGLEDRMGFGWACDPFSREEYIAWLKSLPLNLKKKNEDAVKLCSNEWSEEDERRRDGIIQWLREYQAKFNLKYDSLSIESIESLIDWFKSLRPSWKPSEEQMGALDYAYGELFKRGDVGHNILGPLQKLCDECRRRVKELSEQIKKS